MRREMSLEREIETHAAVIDTHQAAILTAKSKINSLSFISQVPPELMAAIFSFLKTETRVYEPEVPQWIGSVSHVCRRWRDIAINLPSLWHVPPAEWQWNGRNTYEVENA